MSGVRALPLADRPTAARRVARWYVREWGEPGEDPAAAIGRVEAELLDGLEGDGLPSTWLAVSDGRTIGAAQLKRREVPALHGLEHWLGGVWVEPAFRGRGTARLLIGRCVDEARARGVDALHLQTEARNAALYERLGWTAARLPSGKTHERPVMVRRLVR